MEITATAVGLELLILKKLMSRGVQGMNRFQKSLSDFTEERAHRGTTQSCLDAFSSVQSDQTVVDC